MSRRPRRPSQMSIRQHDFTIEPRAALAGKRGAGSERIVPVAQRAPGFDARSCWKVLIATRRTTAFDAVRDLSGRRETAACQAARVHRMSPPTVAAGVIPLLVDNGRMVPESSTIVGYVDRYGDASPMIPTDREAALRSRIWDRMMDGYVAAPVQTVVGDHCGRDRGKDPCPRGRSGPRGARPRLHDARATTRARPCGRLVGRRGFHPRRIARRHLPSSMRTPFTSSMAERSPGARRLLREAPGRAASVAGVDRRRPRPRERGRPRSPLPWPGPRELSHGGPFDGHTAHQPST